MSERRYLAGLHRRWAAEAYPERTAIVFKDRRLNYRELDEIVNRLANAMTAMGLGVGERVGALLKNGVEAVAVPMAIERAGLVYVRLAAAETAEHWNVILEHAEAAAVLLDTAFEQAWKDSAPGRAWRGIEIVAPRAATPGLLGLDDLLAESSPDPPAVRVSPEDLATISYTSGTTGRPKGVVSTVGARLNRLRNDAFNQDIAIGPDDVLLSAAPLTHAAGLYATSYMMRGAKNIIHERFDPGHVFAAIEREGVTAIFLVATMMARLIAHPAARDCDLTSLRRIYYGASPISSEVLRGAIELFGPGVFRQQYGLTEHPQPVALLKADDHVLDGSSGRERRLSSVGRVAMGVEVRISDGSGAQAAPGEAGEILIRSDAGMIGYWKDPESTSRTIVDGWLRTGDVGRFDEDGYLYIVDRAKDMIISGGFNVYPREVEQAIESHPAVIEVAVFGVPDAQWGEAVKAAVSLKNGATITESDLLEHCRKRLASYKKPKSIDFLAELPKSPNGKVLKRELRERYWKGRARKI